MRGNMMDKEKLKKLGADPRFISGIYNYCDRWCERCPFTSRCMNFELSEEEFSDPETRDIENEAFWNKLSETFQVTLELLKEMAEERGIDLDSIDYEESREERQLKNEVAESNACCRAAKAYGRMVDDWFDSARELFGEAEDEAEPVGPLGIGKESPDREETSLEEALEVIRWYQHQIWVKLMRAVRGEMEDRWEGMEEFPKDSDGSAKVALIGMDRSIAAWGEVAGHLPMLNKEVMDIILHLERLRKNVEKEFPDARAFIRPGFDKVDLNG
jgi:hypothetical protein